MKLIPLILCLIVPVWMWYLGKKYRNGNVPFGKEKGIRYRSKRASASEQAWVFANDLYFNMLRMCGINMGLIAVALYLMVFFKADHLIPLLCVILIPIQLIGGFLLPWIFTGVMTRRLFDSDGILLDGDVDEENEEL